MRILDVLLKTVATVLTSLSLVGCPTQFNVKVLNESSSTSTFCLAIQMLSCLGLNQVKQPKLHITLIVLG